MTLKRRFVLFALVLSLVPLSACTGAAEEALRRLETRYETMEAFSAQVLARVELPDCTQDYELAWVCEKDGSTITVTGPEALSGITMRVQDEGLAFSYDDVVLTVEPSGTALSPIEALAELLDDWRGSVPESCCFELCGEENTLAVEFGHMVGAQVFSSRTWFDPVSLDPIRSEVCTDGRMLAVFLFPEFSAYE